jgi:hypothetical protein
MLFDLFTNLFDFIKTALGWVLDGVTWLLGKVVYLIFDGLLTAITAIFNAIDFSTVLSNVVLDWSGIPTQMAWAVSSLGIPQGLTVLASAVTIRMLLNLIPASVTRI